MPHFLSAILLIAFTGTALTSAPVQEEITIYWTDRGVGQWTEELKLFDNFDRLANRGVTDVRHEGQILLPMAPDGANPRSDKEWDSLSHGILLNLRKKLQEAIAKGDTKFEVLQVENITLAQHLAETRGGSKSQALRQANVDKFTEAVGKALYELKLELSAKKQVKVIAVGGSNGGRTFSRVIPKLERQQHNPVDRLKLIDARANLAEADEAVKAMKGRVDIYNTEGDAPASPLIIANRSASQRLKQLHPEINVYDVKPDGVNVNRHVVVMKKDSPPLMWRENTGSGFTDAKNGDRNELLFGKSDPRNNQAVNNRQASNSRKDEPNAASDNFSVSKSDTTVVSPKAKTAEKATDAINELRRNLDNASDSTASNQGLRDRLQSQGVRVVTPSEAVSKGTAQITGTARIGYSRTDVQIINNTDEWLAIDFSGSYLIPASSSSTSQRLGLVAAVESQSSLVSPMINSNRLASLNIAADSVAMGATQGSLSNLLAYSLKTNFVPSTYRYEQSVPAQNDNGTQGWSIKHWVVVAPRANITVPFHSVCLDSGRATPSSGERFYMSDRPLPTRVQQILVAASLRGDVPQGQVWETIQAERIRWFDPRVSIDSLIVQARKDYEGGSHNSVVDICSYVLTERKDDIEVSKLIGLSYHALGVNEKDTAKASEYFSESVKYLMGTIRAGYDFSMPVAHHHILSSKMGIPVIGDVCRGRLTLDSEFLVFRSESDPLHNFISPLSMIDNLNIGSQNLHLEVKFLNEKGEMGKSKTYNFLPTEVSLSTSLLPLGGAYSIGVNRIDCNDRCPSLVTFLYNLVSQAQKQPVEVQNAAILSQPAKFNLIHFANLKKNQHKGEFSISIDGIKWQENSPNADTNHNMSVSWSNVTKIQWVIYGYNVSVNLGNKEKELTLQGDYSNFLQIIKLFYTVGGLKPFAGKLVGMPVPTLKRID